MRCFATCPQLDLIGSLRDAGLWPEAPDRKVMPQLAPTNPVVTRHPYYDQNGQLVAIHVRKDFGGGRKSMPWELPDGRLSANGDINTADLPLYGLANVLERLDKAVILVEGEKAADAAMAEGLVAVSLSGGANQPDFGTALESLRGRDVLLWPDNDRPGLELMLRVESQLKGIAARIQWLSVPNLPLKGDAADYFADDRTLEELRQYVVQQVPLQLEEPVLKPRRFKLLSAAELKNRPDPEWLVDNIIQRDTLALIVGAQETFKSFVALDLAMSIAEGLAWQGHICKQGPAVYVSAEGGSGLGLRVCAWELARDTLIQHCFFLPDQAPQFLDGRADGDIEELLLSLSDMPSQPSFIVVDTLARVMVGHDENSVEHMGMLIATADRVRQSTGATVAFVHHNNRQGSARGSSSLLGAVHTILDCSRDTNSPFVVVKCGKQKDAEHFQTMLLESRQIDLGISPESGLPRTSLVLDSRGSTLFQDDTIPRIAPASRVLLEVLVRLDRATFAQWRDAAKMAKTTFHDARLELIRNRYVDHMHDGVYQPTSLGRSIGSGGSEQGRIDPVRPMVGERVGGGGPLREGPHRPSDHRPSDPVDPLPWTDPAA